VKSIDSSTRTVDNTQWPIDAFLAQLHILGSYASYCLAGAIWIWSKQASAMTGQNELKPLYDSVVEVVMTTTNQRNLAPVASGRVSTTEASMTAIMQVIAETVTRLPLDSARAFLVALSAAWVTRLNADDIRSTYQARHDHPLFAADDTDLSREVLQWMFDDLCDIAAVDPS